MSQIKFCTCLLHQYHVHTFQAAFTSLSIRLMMLEAEYNTFFKKVRPWVFQLATIQSTEHDVDIYLLSW